MWDLEVTLYWYIIGAAFVTTASLLTSVVLLLKTRATASRRMEKKLSIKLRPSVVRERRDRISMHSASRYRLSANHAPSAGGANDSTSSERPYRYDDDFSIADALEFVYPRQDLVTMVGGSQDSLLEEEVFMRSADLGGNVINQFSSFRMPSNKKRGRPSIADARNLSFRDPRISRLAPAPPLPPPGQSTVSIVVTKPSCDSATSYDASYAEIGAKLVDEVFPDHWEEEGYLVGGVGGGGEGYELGEDIHGGEELYGYLVGGTMNKAYTEEVFNFPYKSEMTDMSEKTEIIPRLYNHTKAETDIDLATEWTYDSGVFTRSPSTRQLTKYLSPVDNESHAHISQRVDKEEEISMDKYDDRYVEETAFDWSNHYDEAGVKKSFTKRSAKYRRFDTDDDYAEIGDGVGGRKVIGPKDELLRALDNHYQVEPCKLSGTVSIAYHQLPDDKFEECR